MAALVMHSNIQHSRSMTLYNEDGRIYMIDVDKRMNYLSIRHIMLNMVNLKEKKKKMTKKNKL